MIRALFIAAYTLLVCSCTNSSGKSIAVDNDTTLHTAASTAVLIELFTSQGCSSCPAADKLVGNLISDTNIISLSFHVDYWDRLGWKDVFSNHDYTARQGQYVRTLHAESLYTPQAVVQGKYEMVGSNRKRVLDAIDKVRLEASDQTITAIASVNCNTININYNISQVQPQHQLFIALVQNKVTTPVRNGENAGAELTDYNVVRNLSMQPAQPKGSKEITLPGDLGKNDTSIVLFTQNEQTKVIDAVTKLRL